MRPRALALVLLLSFVASVGSAQQDRRQGGARRPGGGGARGGGVQPLAGGGGGDYIAPWITLNAPGFEITTQYPSIEIEYCDNVSLNTSTWWVKLNGNLVTGSFSYGSVTPLDCGARAIATSSSVAFGMGANTLQSRICDNVGNCTTATWTITRTGPGAPTITLKNQNGDNLDRGLCLTMGAGEAAGLSCGDLFVTHGLPSYRTMGRDRALTPFYNSAAAAPRPLVATVVSQAYGTQTPSSILAELRVFNGSSYVTRASATYSGVTYGYPAQIALAYDASGDASGVYPYRLVITNVYSGVGAWADSVSGELLVANRGGSEFGAGWWLAGVEQLVTGQSGGRILWLGGDGSAAVYNQITSTYWQRAAGPFRDSLTLAGGEYTRHLRHGVKVVFDAAGRHVRTVNRAGHTTTFTWSGSPARLTSVQVPPGGSGTTYTLAYEGIYQYIDYIDDPAGRRLDPYIASWFYGTRHGITYITDPDGVSVGYTYDSVGRMLTRQNRMGRRTRYVFGSGLHVTEVRIPLDSLASSPYDTALTTLAWWDEEGLAIGSPGGTVSPADTTFVSTRVDGPRTDVSDIATFWVDRWGAPTRAIGAVNDTTRAVRSASTGLVSRLETPVHQILGLTYDGRGNLLTQSDSTHEGHGTGGFQTATIRYTYRSAQTADAPDSIIDPEGGITRFFYNALGFDSLAISATGQVTRFAYGTGSQAGLVTSVTELQVPTYTDTTNWGGSITNTDQATQFTFTSLGNVETSTSPMGSVSRYVYNAFTQVERTINAVGDTTRYFPRAMGVLDSTIQIAPSGNRRALMTYDAAFKLLTISDSRGVTRSWRYDMAGRDTAEVDDYGYRERRFYNPAGQLELLRLRSGDTVRTAYDQGGRRTLTRYPARMAGDTARGDTVTMTYDAAGRLLTASNRSGTVTRQYYREGTLRQEQQNANAGVGGGFDVIDQYRYDRADRRTWYANFCAASGCNDTLLLTYTYASGMPERIVIDYPGSSPTTDTVTYQWDGLGRRSQVITPHRVTMQWFYDQDGRVRRVVSSHACSYWCAAQDSAVVDEQYRSYDRANRALNIVRWVGGAQNSESQGYDAFGQLSHQIQDGTRRDYTYDLSGNMLSDLNWVGGVRYGRTVVIDPGHNRLVRDSTVDQSGGHLSATYTYSLNGERLRDEPPTANQRWRRTWFDALGKLTSVESYQVYNYQRAPDTEVNYYSYSGAIESNINSCRYDALGRQIKPCGGLAMSFDGAQVVRVRGTRLIYGPALGDLLAVYDSAIGAGSAALYYALTDGGGHLYSFTDSSGADYREAPNQVYMDRASFSGALVRGHRFTAAASESYASEDLSFFRNRYYDQRTGQWLSEDPIGVAGGLNLYGYVGNNPVAYADPFGLCIWDGCILEFVAASTVAFAGIRAVANVITGRPVGENVLHDANVGFTVATAIASFGAPAGRVMAALDAAGRAEAAAAAGEAGAIGSVRVATTTEANVAARIWTGVGGRQIANRSSGELVGRISADATRVGRLAARKANGTVAANLENVLNGSNMHVVVQP